MLRQDKLECLSLAIILSRIWYISLSLSLSVRVRACVCVYVYVCLCLCVYQP